MLVNRMRTGDGLTWTVSDAFVTSVQNLTETGLQFVTVNDPHHVDGDRPMDATYSRIYHVNQIVYIETGVIL